MPRLVKIILDSNTFKYNRQENLIKIFRSELDDLRVFIETNKLAQSVELQIPEVAIQECLYSRLRDIDTTISEVKIKIEGLKTVKAKFGQVDCESPDYKSILERETKNTLKKLNIGTLKYAKSDVALIVDRAYHKIPPFMREKDSSDKGFKDSLMWLSILRDAKQNPSHDYILVSADRGFQQKDELEKEFTQYPEQKINFLSSTEELTTYLDKHFNLDLEIQNRNEEIKQEVKRLSGDIMVQFNTSLDREGFYAGGVLNRVTLLNSSDNTGKDQYNLKDLTDLSVSEIGSNMYRISAVLTVREVSKKIYNSWAIHEPGSVINFRHRTSDVKQFAIELTYHRNIQQIDLTSRSERSIYDPLMFEGN